MLSGSTPPVFVGTNTMTVRQGRQLLGFRGVRLPPFQPPYDGSYKVIRPGQKCFRLLVGSCEDRIEVAHLNPSVDSPASWFFIPFPCVFSPQIAYDVGGAGFSAFFMGGSSSSSDTIIYAVLNSFGNV